MFSHVEISPNQAQEKAIAFLALEWELPQTDQDWLTVLTARLIGESWYVVELGVEGLPDKWVIQVYDTGECDPDYTFMSPIATLDAAEADLFPAAIAAMLQSERQSLAAMKR